jgi:Ran GTPase-activating protein (RanGAP) involved in mRNA processing and transport
MKMSNIDLINLDYSQKRVDLAKAKEITNELLSKKFVNMLNLRNTGMDLETIKFIFNFLKEKKIYVEKIDLCHNDFTSKEAKQIAEFLEKNKTVKSISLRHNKIDSEGLEHIIKALKDNKTLTELDVTSNGIIELKEIAEGLNNTSLKSLNLSDNYLIGDKAKDLATVLEKNPNLTDLNLRLCTIKEEGISSILKSMCKNEALKTLNLEHNPGIYQSMQEIAKTLQVKYKATLKLSPLKFQIVNVERDLKENYNYEEALKELKALKYINETLNLGNDFTKIDELLTNKGFEALEYVDKTLGLDSDSTKFDDSLTKQTDIIGDL